MGDRKVNNNSPTDCSEEDHKINNKLPSDYTEGDNYRSIETNISPQGEEFRDISQQNNNSSSIMYIQGDKYNDEYYVSIKNGPGQRIVKPNRFEKSAAIALGILTCQCNDFQKNSRPGSIKTIKN